jgi:hypothetical protein
MHPVAGPRRGDAEEEKFVRAKNLFGVTRNAAF